jgi:hypothetical protein
MRDNGVVMRETGKYSVLATLRDAIDEARCDIAHMPMSEERGAHTESLRRFDFENIPASGTENLRTMRDAALSIRSAAHVLHSAGVFHGVAQQIADNAQTIERSCLAHETTLLRASRMAALICELEAELITAAEDDSVEPFYDGPSDPCRQDNGKNIPDDVVEELSLALAECYDGGEFNGSAKR